MYLSCISPGELLRFGAYHAARWECEPWGAGIAQPTVLITFMSLEGKVLLRKLAWTIWICFTSCVFPIQTCSHVGCDKHSVTRSARLFRTKKIKLRSPDASLEDLNYLSGLCGWPSSSAPWLLISESQEANDARTISKLFIVYLAPVKPNWDSRKWKRNQS